MELPDNMIKRDRLFKDNHIKVFKFNEKRLVMNSKVKAMAHVGGSASWYENRKVAEQFLKELCPHTVKVRGTNLPVPRNTKGYFYMRDGHVGFQYEADAMWYGLSNGK